jgi:predicted RNase H-like HicB family nuclease
MKQVTAIIEKSTDGLFSVYIENNPLRYGVIGEGKTVAEALEDFKGGYEDMRDYYKSEGKDFEEAEFSFKYDIPSFLQYYAYAFTLAGLERITGVNQRQLSHYISGFRKPSEKTALKIEEKIKTFAKEIESVRFV